MRSDAAKTGYTNGEKSGSRILLRTGIVFWGLNFLPWDFRSNCAHTTRPCCGL